MKTKLLVSTAILSIILVGCNDVKETEYTKNESTKKEADTVANKTVTKGAGWEFNYDENGKRIGLEVDDKTFKIYLRDNVGRFTDIKNTIENLNIKNMVIDYMYSYEGYKFITVEFGKEDVINENMSMLVYIENMFMNNYSQIYLSGKTSRTEYMGKYVYDMYIKQQDKVYKIDGSKLTNVYDKEIFNSFIDEISLKEYEKLVGESASLFEGINFFNEGGDNEK